jgi:hypothetical protein
VRRKREAALTTNSSTDEPGRHARAERRIDVISTVLLSLATLATAWAGYQSTRWHSEQAKEQAAATKNRIEATRSADVANREAQVDVALFIEWVDARAQDNRELADFYRDRFTDRFKPAFAAWSATEPFTNPDAPSSPFVMEQYKLAASDEAESLETAANSAGAEAVEDIERADKYVLAVVLFASCLFFAGLSTRLRTPTTRAVVLGLGCVLFLGTVAWIATFPVTVSF